MTDFKSQGVRLWKRLHAAPAGSLPAGSITKVAVVAGTGVILLFLTFYVFLGGGEDATVALPGADVPAQSGGDFTVPLQSNIRQQQQQAELERLAAERDARAAMRDGLIAGQVGPLDAEIEAAGPNPDTGLPYTEAEYQLREALRLEAMERRVRSLRSAPVAQSYRGTGTGAAGGPARQDAGGAGEAAASPQEATAAAQEAEINRLRDTFTLAAQGIADSADQAVADEIARLQAGGAVPALPGLPAAGGLAMNPGLAAALAARGGPAAAPPRDYTDPARATAPDDPPGWERVYEGSFLEGVLITQLSGEFPGPALAMVSVPFYSADRGRVLIPRGTRVVGSAAAVANADQGRLAVGFHRLIFPDGRWVTLEFTGLNRIGEGALKDQVNRHYFSTFAAVGAVGILSGLTLRGSNPFGGGGQSFQAGVGQGLGQAATQMLDRFLNRLPEITIRAGHRLRIWFTSDVLIPAPEGEGD